MFTSLFINKDKVGMTPLNLQFAINRKQRGVTLIEVLITIVIMAFGLLGVVLMQTISLKSNYESSQRTIANYLVEDIISRIRSVPLANITAYDTGSSPIGSSNPSTKPEKPCTPALDKKCDDIADKIKNDLWEWKELLTGTAGLLNANGCINTDDPSLTNQIQVTISWDGIGKSKSSNTTSCGTGSNDFKRRSLTVFTLHQD